MLKNVIKQLLQQIISDIDSGNSNISESEQMQIINLLQEVSSPYVSKYTACQMLHVSRSTFDSYVAQGRLPHGMKRQGFKELVWRKSDIQHFVTNTN